MKNKEDIMKEIERLEKNHFYTFKVEPMLVKESARHLQEERIRALRWVIEED